MSSVETERDDFTDWVERVKAELEILKKSEIHVGILGDADGELLTIARVHEYGATITPKNAKNLAIPLKPSMRGKSPREINNTWIYRTDEGDLFIARNKGKDEFECLFILLPSVTIPERSFIRAGYDGNKDLIAKACEKALQGVVAGKLTASEAANNIGVACVGMIKKYMTTVSLPKSAITLASSPGKTTPLVHSGRLRNSITFEVVTS